VNCVVAFATILALRQNAPASEGGRYNGEERPD